MASAICGFRVGQLRLPNVIVGAVLACATVMVMVFMFSSSTASNPLAPSLSPETILSNEEVDKIDLCAVFPKVCECEERDTQVIWYPRIHKAASTTIRGSIGNSLVPPKSIWGPGSVRKCSGTGHPLDWSSLFTRMRWWWDPKFLCLYGNSVPVAESIWSWMLRSLHGEVSSPWKARHFLGKHMPAIAPASSWKPHMFMIQSFREPVARCMSRYGSDRHHLPAPAAESMEKCIEDGWCMFNTTARDEATLSQLSSALWQRAIGVGASEDEANTIVKTALHCSTDWQARWMCADRPGCQTAEWPREAARVVFDEFDIVGVTDRLSTLLHLITVLTPSAFGGAKEPEFFDQKGWKNPTSAAYKPTTLPDHLKDRIRAANPVDSGLVRLINKALDLKLQACKDKQQQR